MVEKGIENYRKVLTTIQDNITLVAISKTKPEQDIEMLYQAGQRVFGENRAIELERKHDNLPKDIQWHMVGHIQRNKLKHITAYVDTIHSGDSMRLLKDIDKEANKHDRTINILLQIKIAAEDTKYGWDIETLLDLAKDDQFSSLNHIKIIGVMGMATFTDDKEQVRSEFRSLKSHFDSLKPYFDADFKEISMGMSGDYLIAIEEGATMVRLGSILFGARG